MAASAPVVIASNQTSIPAALAAGSARAGQVQITGSATASALALAASVTAYGNLRISAEPTQLFNDPFDGVVIDTTDRWNAAVVTGGMTVTQVGGGLSVTTNTTASASAFIDSKPTFTPLGLAFLAYGEALKLEAQTSNFFVSNQHRFFGLGDRPASFAYATPLKNAFGFEIDGTGQLLCCVYSNGTRIYSTSTSLTGVNLNTLVTPSAGYCRFGVAQRADAYIFYIGTTEYPAASFSVASASFSLSDIQSLPIRHHAINNSTSPASVSTFVASNVAIGDTSSSGVGLSDGVFGYRKATVKAASVAAVAADTALVVGLSPNSPMPLPTITKGTQAATGVTVQELKDAGRNPVHYYTLIPVLTSATDTLQSLTGTKSGATVAATTTPAVVTAGKTLRITRLSATYIATATSGYGIVRLRFNTAGVVAITSPVAMEMCVGAGTPATANSTGSEDAAVPDGLEFAAATGIGVSVQGFAAVTATAVGYVLVSVSGFEY